ncbi:uncharacterized protein [Chelonus insularis]|uniref:uncharacterized protein n=1 Tax=Chelonus insularis TaxID=460826 RepID=UPI00158B9C13|nr:uncharacterized protein LOC118070733 [Chelonus insularis]
MIKIIFIIAILFHSPNWVEPLSIPIITNLQDLIGLAHDIGDIAAGNIPFKNFFNPAVNPINTVLDKIDGVVEQIENLDTKLDDLLATVIARLPLEDNINTDIRDLQQLLTRIDETYDDFLAYSQNISIYDDDTLLDFVHIVTSARDGNIPNVLKKIFTIIVPKETALARVGFLGNMLQRRTMMSPLEKCGSPISFQNRLLQIYNLISITEMRAFVMTMFGFRLKRELKNSKSIGEIARAKSQFVMRLDQYLVEFRKVMRKASREIYLCDPESLTDRSNYLEFEGLFTAFVINEYQVDKNCATTCPTLSPASYNLCYDYASHYCMKHPCRGKIHDCGWIGGQVDMCEYVRSYANGWYGSYSTCSNGTYEEVIGELRDIYRCDTCICKCEENLKDSKAIRTFSLRKQITNIDENKVLSDVKFVLKNKMIHIQIEEAPLLPIGQLNKNESSWVPLEDFEYFPEFAEGLFFLVKENWDYHHLYIDVDYTFIQGDHKTLYLDEISAGPNFVVTGVRLNHETVTYSDDGSSRNVSPIQLEIHVTPFDYLTGKLTPTDDNPSRWIEPLTQPKLPPAYAKPREELGDGAEKVYLDNSVQNPPHLQPNKYIKFKQSTIFDDAGQSTLPFMDARSIAPSNFLAFDGLGLAYRAHDQYGGFVILKGMTIDATNYMDATMSAEQQKYYTKYSRQSVRNTPSNG